MKKQVLSMFAFLTLGISVNAQNVNIPDANFKAYLVGITAINTNEDTEISVAEAQAYTGTINCSSLGITDLTGIEAFTNIPYLFCSNNQLTSLDVSNNTALTYVSCSSNQLTSLDVSNNTVLITLVCNDNLLTSLNVANGNNQNFTAFWAFNNPNLTCIQVDDANYSTTNWTNSNGFPKDVTATYSEDCSSSCTVTIPDANFKAYLVGNSAINTNGDTEIQCVEAQAFTGQINCQSLSIADLTGIEAFTNLTELYCGWNQLTALDVSNNTALTTFGCAYNSLTSLDVSNNTALTLLNCERNELTSLNISNNTSLTYLSCGRNQLTSLDVSNNTVLETMYCERNQLTSLDVSNNIALTGLSAYDTPLTSIDLSNNTALIWVQFAFTQIASLDLSNNTALTEVHVNSNNQLTTLDISQNTLVTKLKCDDMDQLTSVNVANGNNANFQMLILENNPDLTCIQVDDAAYSTTNWTGSSFTKDATASFSEDCATFLGINELNTELVEVYPNPANSTLNIHISKSTEVQIVDVLGKIISTQNLKAGTNSMDVSNLTKGVYFVQGSGVNVKFIKE